MRDCFGNARLVALPGGYGLEAPGLHKPLILRFGGDTPDLSSIAGKIVTYNGHLPTISGNLEEATIEVAELQIADQEISCTPIWAVVIGNLGKAPEANPKGDRVGASIAYADNAWLRLAAYTYFSCTDKFKELEAGKRILVYGCLESYEYKDSDRLQLAIQSFGLVGASNATRKPTVLYSSPSPTTGEDVTVDAFTAA